MSVIISSDRVETKPKGKPVKKEEAPKKAVKSRKKAEE